MSKEKTGIIDAIKARFVSERPQLDYKEFTELFNPLSKWLQGYLEQGETEFKFDDLQKQIEQFKKIKGRKLRPSFVIEDDEDAIDIAMLFGGLNIPIQAAVAIAGHPMVALALCFAVPIVAVLCLDSTMYLYDDPSTPEDQFNKLFKKPFYEAIIKIDELEKARKASLSSFGDNESVVCQVIDRNYKIKQQKIVEKTIKKLEKERLYIGRHNVYDSREFVKKNNENMVAGIDKLQSLSKQGKTMG